MAVVDKLNRIRGSSSRKALDRGFQVVCLLVASLALVILIIGFSMFGDGLEELLDPRRSKTSR
ncbi:MAG: hypothetical protein ACK557_18810 [Planctomycetota bacterium]